jgi:hypothetical protein
MSSNIVKTIDQTGKHKWQNLDSAFNGKYEDLLTLGKGEAAFGVVPAAPVKSVVLATADATVKVAGPCKTLFVNATEAGCTVNIAGLEIPAGTAFHILVEGGESVTVSGLGINSSMSGLQFFLMRPDGTLYWWD